MACEDLIRIVVWRIEFWFGRLYVVVVMGLTLRGCSPQALRLCIPRNSVWSAKTSFKSWFGVQVRAALELPGVYIVPEKWLQESLLLNCPQVRVGPHHIFGGPDFI